MFDLDGREFAEKGVRDEIVGEGEGGDRGGGGGIGRDTSYFFINNVILCVFKCSQAFVRVVRGR